MLVKKLFAKDLGLKFKMLCANYKNNIKSKLYARITFDNFELIALPVTTYIII